MDLPGFIISGLIFNALIIAFSFLVIFVRISAKYLRHNLPWWLRWDITLATITIVSIAVESTSAALEQTSPHKLKTAEYGMIMVTISVVLGFGDLVFKKYMNNRHRKANKDINLEWNFADSFGLVSSVLTLITASLHYHCVRNGKQQPVQFSVMPLAFSMCIFCSCILRRPVGQVHPQEV